MTRPHHQTDAQLVATFAATRSPDALEGLLGRHWPTAYRLALRSLGSPAAAEDVAQQAFLDLVDAAARFDPRLEFGPWFRTLVLNRVRMHERGAARRRRHEEGAAALRPERTRVSASAALEAEDVAAQVTALPDDVRVPIVLHYYEGLTHAEVAQELGCPKGTAASRIRRGLEQLQEALVGAGAAALVPVSALEDLLRGASPPVAPTAPRAVSLLARPGVGRGTLHAGLGLAVLLIVFVAGLGSLLDLSSPEPEPPLRKATLPAPRNAAGSFTVAAVETDSSGAAPVVTVVSSPAGEAVATAKTDALDPMPAVAARVSDASVDVTVVDDLGRPLAGAFVQPTSIARMDGDTPVIDGDFKSEEVRADERGTARVPVTGGLGYGFLVNPDHQQVFRDQRAWSEGRDPEVGLPQSWALLPPFSDLVRVGPGESPAIRLVVPRRTRVTLRVSGVPSAELDGVAIKLTTGRPPFQPIETPDVDADGVARTLADAGLAELVVTCPGFETVRRNVDMIAGARVDVDVPMTPATARVQGWIVDRADGAPIDGATVRCDPQSAVSAAGGAFELWREAGTATLTITAPGHCRTEVQVTASSTPAAVRVTLQRAATVEVSTLDAAGSPIAVDVWVRGALSTPDLEWCDPVAGRFDGPRWSGRMTLNGEHWVATGKTGAEGVLRLEALPPGRYEAGVGGPWGAEGIVVEARAGEVTRVTLRARGDR